MANWDPQLVTPTLTSAPTALSGMAGPVNAGTVKQHHGVIGLVLVAAVGLVALNKAGFRFAVTAGRG